MHIIISLSTIIHISNITSIGSGTSTSTSINTSTSSSTSTSTSTSASTRLMELALRTETWHWHVACLLLFGALECCGGEEEREEAKETGRGRLRRSPTWWSNWPVLPPASPWAKTRDITVKVEPQFLAEQSDPVVDQYFWLYTISIENGGTETVQLLNRHWVITNAVGHVEEIQGPGVVGEQPVLAPGERFQYTSGCPLKTPSGLMVGTYEMADPDGSNHFDIDIPAFSLDSPHQARQLN